MSDLIPVEEHRDLARDPVSNAIINTNQKAYQQAVENYKRARAEKEKLASLENDINNIKNDISELKDILLKAIGNK